ncbi:MAG: hypothetical protein BWZ10_01180 [candidate division BRC1 bacterium ADurb.BinA364]|nr:MAG: hypothetical protein BWZ10_01180 [candidate division BRC1 bacterium ADurb.BinA364]
MRGQTVDIGGEQARLHRRIVQVAEKANAPRRLKRRGLPAQSRLLGAGSHDPGLGVGGLAHGVQQDMQAFVIAQPPDKRDRRALLRRPQAGGLGGLGGGRRHRLDIDGQRDAFAFGGEAAQLGRGFQVRNGRRHDHRGLAKKSVEKRPVGQQRPSLAHDVAMPGGHDRRRRPRLQAGDRGRRIRQMHMNQIGAQAPNPARQRGRQRRGKPTAEGGGLDNRHALDAFALGSSPPIGDQDRWSEFVAGGPAHQMDRFFRAADDRRPVVLVNMQHARPRIGRRRGVLAGWKANRGHRDKSHETGYPRRRQNRTARRQRSWRHSLSQRRAIRNQNRAPKPRIGASGSPK